MVFQTHGNAMKLIDIHATLKSEISLDIVPIQCGFYFNIYNEDTRICQDLYGLKYAFVEQALPDKNIKGNCIDALKKYCEDQSSNDLTGEEKQDARDCLEDYIKTEVTKNFGLR